MKAMVVTVAFALLATQTWGAEILFVSNHEGNWEIYSTNERGENVKRLTDDPGIDAHARWSPDGRKILFHSDRNGNRDVFMMNADGTGVRQITNTPVPEAKPEWSPDGKRIAFFSNGIVYAMD